MIPEAQNRTINQEEDMVAEKAISGLNQSRTRNVKNTMDNIVVRWQNSTTNFRNFILASSVCLIVCDGTVRLGLTDYKAIADIIHDIIGMGNNLRKQRHAGAVSAIQIVSDCTAQIFKKLG